MEGYNQDTLPDKSLSLWNHACEYDRYGDMYQAIKLYRRLIRAHPRWIPPFLRLIFLYSDRLEWKQVFAFCKRVVSLDVTRKEIWWLMGISAELTGKTITARRIWTKFNVPIQRKNTDLVCLRTMDTGILEIFWGQRLGPANARIISIPRHRSSYTYQDIVYFQVASKEHQVVQFKKYTIHDILFRKEASGLRTFSCKVKPVSREVLDDLIQIGTNVGVGVECWSKGSSAGDAPMRKSQEPPSSPADHQLWIGLSGKDQAQVLGVLSAWEMIHALSYTDFRDHGNSPPLKRRL